MNERIKKLCEQAKGYANESTKDFTGDEPVCWMDFYTEKFAELIVRDCDQYARSYWEHGELLGGDLKRLFGIEECPELWPKY